MDHDLRTLPSTPARPVLGEPARRRRRTAHGLAAGGGGGARRTAVGAFGERLAARHLESVGLVVLDRNWRCELGEADLVAVLPRRPEAGAPHPATPLLVDTVVVCEVKTRTTTRFGSPAQQVTAQKVSRLRRVARRWLEEHPEVRGARVRVDVLGVLVPTSGAAQVDHRVGVSA